MSAANALRSEPPEPEGELDLSSSTVSALTERQKQVLCFIADDMNNREIAAALNIHPKTVEFHRNRIKRSAGVKGVAGMVRYAVRIGLVQP